MPPQQNNQSGLITPGNVDLYAQPKVKNPDGTTSTVDSHSYGFDGKEYLLPSVTPDGRHLKTDAEIIAEYRKTGRHLGVFKDPTSATKYATQLHNDYAAGKYEKKQQDEFAQYVRKPAAAATDAFSQYARSTPTPTTTPTGLTDALSKTTGIGPGPGKVGQAWEQFKGGFGSGGEGSGLHPQPTAAGNVGQLARFLGEAELMTGGAMGAAEVAKMIPIASRASHALNEVAKVPNPIVVDTTKAMKVADKALYLGEHGHKPPQVITDFAKRVTSGQPITFQEARDFYSAATSLSSQEVQETKSIMKGQIGKFTAALHDSLTQAADAVGQGKTYEKAIAEYHKAKTMWRVATKAGKIAATSAAGAIGAGAGYEIYKAAR